MAIVLFDWFLVNFCNTAADWKEDSFNNVEFSQLAKRNQSMIKWVCLVLTLVSFLIHTVIFPNLLWMRIVGHLLGIMYNFPVLPGGKRLKQLYMLKNLSSCMGFLITLFGYPLSCLPLREDVSLYYIIVLIGFFAPLEISFEIIYDLRDEKGDKLAGIQSFPVANGIAWSKRAVIMLDIISICVMLLGLALEIVIWKDGVMLCGVVLQLILFYFLNLTGFQKSHIIWLTWAFVLSQLQYVCWNLVGLPTEASFLFGEITPIKIINIGMIVIGVLTCAWSRKFFSLTQFLVAYVSIAISGGICENSVIILYDFYHYNQIIWSYYVGVMPLEVTLIWPQVIFTSYRLLRENFKVSGLKMAVIGSMEIFGLAYFVEISCVSRGFWSWTKSNLAGVPIIGVLGWAIFAFCAFLALDSLSRSKSWWQTIILPISSAIVVHIGVVGLWFLGFWYISEFDIPVDKLAPVLMVGSPIMLVILYKFCRHRLELTVAQEIPRLCAAFLLLFTFLKGNPSRDLTLVVCSLALPYFGVLKLGWPEFLKQEREQELNYAKSTPAKKAS